MLTADLAGFGSSRKIKHRSTRKLMECQVFLDQIFVHIFTRSSQLSLSIQTNIGALKQTVKPRTFGL
jgi:hypothetical protein